MKCIFIEQKPQIAFCRNDHYKNILRCDMIWHNLSAHNNTACTKFTFTINLRLPIFRPKNASLIILQVILNGIGFIMPNGNETKCNEISLQTITKMQRFVDFYYSNATLDEFGISFPMLPALPLGKLTHSNVD